VSEGHTTALSPEAIARLEVDAKEVIARYPQPRSALLPLLHLVQSEQGYVSPAGIEFCAAQLGLTTAEVSAVATFYTMYKRRPVGRYHVGVCTNTLCAVMGGDAIFADLKAHLGVGNDETTEDGMVTLEHVECNAACDYAPVVMVNWEFFDNQTPQSARALVDQLRSGAGAVPTRGAAQVATFTETERLLAGFYDGRAGEGVGAGPASLAGLRLARDTAAGEGTTRPDEGPGRGTGTGEGLTTGYGAEGGPSGSDAPAETAESDPANASAPGHADDASTDEGDRA
jgi:NADH-quinone oxidoreductase subunit E